MIVVGALAAAPQDRAIDRAAVVPVQVVTAAGMQPVPFFRDIGELGVSAFAFRHPDDGPALPSLCFSTGDDLHEIDLSRGVVNVQSVEGLRDVHEMTWDREVLCIASTGSDEIVRYDPAAGRVIDRESLDRFRRRSGGYRAGGAAMASDRFHANQAFTGLDGQRWVLVHHVNGWQLLERVAERTVKVHGNGGVLNLASSVAVPLGLFAPHSVRLVDDQYCVFDSGRSLGHTYDHDWNRIATFPTLGWGRGAALDLTGQLLFAGMSPIRRRYRLRAPERSVPTCTLERFSVTDWSPSGACEIPDMEQINNVYVVASEVADALLAFSG